MTQRRLLHRRRKGKLAKVAGLVEFVEIADPEALRALLCEKQHLECHKDQLDILHDRAILDVEHVQLELILKVGVVFSVDLRISR